MNDHFKLALCSAIGIGLITCSFIYIDRGENYIFKGVLIIAFLIGCALLLPLSQKTEKALGMKITDLSLVTFLLLTGLFASFQFVSMNLNAESVAISWGYIMTFFTFLVVAFTEVLIMMFKKVGGFDEKLKIGFSLLAVLISLISLILSLVK